MKAVLAYVLLAGYLLVNSGMVINTHFCGDKLVETSFYSSLTKCSGETQQSHNTLEVQCCEINSLHVVGEEDQITSHDYTALEFPQFTAVVPAVLIAEQVPTASEWIFQLIEGPPLIFAKYIKYSQLLVYS